MAPTIDPPAQSVDDDDMRVVASASCEAWIDSAGTFHFRAGLIVRGPGEDIKIEQASTNICSESSLFVAVVSDQEFPVITDLVRLSRGKDVESALPYRVAVLLSHDERRVLAACPVERRP